MKRCLLLTVLPMLTLVAACNGQSKKKTSGNDTGTQSAAPAPRRDSPGVLRPSPGANAPMPTVKPDTTRTNMPVAPPQPGVQPK